MNRTKLWLIVTRVVFVLTMVIFLEIPASVGAQNCFTVKIWDRDKIESLALSINKNDCVVWVNFSTPSPGSSGELSGTAPSDVLVSFPEATTCVINEVKAPVGFKMDVATNCFVAGWLRPGETSSLVFTKPGTYKYNIEFKFGQEVRGKTEGTVVVK